ncbi:prealbumin-like fold domain-containing protein [Enterococcus rivorum]|uniref:prealbumin-like fold domain-containing protein n=1 Tax=Enterococcus rivorum TaxID=762845 RepID=UPI003640D4C7
MTINQAGAGEAGATFTGAFTNYQGSVLLNKFSVEAKKPLENAVFELYTKDEKVITSSLKTNKEGQIVVEKLAPGEYYFIEKEAPKGYELSLEKQVFTINKAATGKPEQIVLTMTNKLKPEVPVKPKKLDEKEGTIGKFGEQVRNVFVIVGAVLVIGVIGYTIWKKKK